MSESEAIVTQLDGDHVWLDVNGNSNCSSCESSQGCGLGDGHGKRLQRVRNTVGAMIGDAVILSVPDGAVLRASLVSYLMPLVLAIGGAVAGMSINGDAGAVAGSLAGLVIGWIAMSRAGGRLATGREPLLKMRIKEVVVQLHRNR
ncbi:MAG TPA: SoxR reducing system RseC family protein [Rhodocyclaceae bacterium]|nr:SoxR reducing system RseC family protein [Rhodocyclaceae bacterium]